MQRAIGILLQMMKGYRCMKKLKTYMIYAALTCLLLLAAGCTEPSLSESTPVESSKSESRPTVSEESLFENSSTAGNDSSVEISDIELSIPPEDSSEVQSSKPQDESSFVPDFSGIYRDEEEEPTLEDIEIPPIEEKEFGFKKTELTIEIGQNNRIPYEFYPVGTTNQVLTWTSSEADVVSVNEDGILTGLRLGQSVVTAVSSKGNTATCTVTVVAEIPLSPLAKLIRTYADGNLANKSFAYVDVNMDGKEELIGRSYGAYGFPVITIIDTESGAVLATFTTGSDEEWGIWKRKNGSMYLLLSYTQNYPNGAVRYGLDEITFEGGITFAHLMARETQSSGNTYYKAEGGQLKVCDHDAYQGLRQVYFADNHQTDVLEPLWMGGTDAEEIATALKNPPKK